MTSDDAGRLVVFAGCLYEQVALASKWVDDVPEIPTISELCWRGVDHRLARFGVWAFGGFALWHLFVRPESPLSPIQPQE